MRAQISDENAPTTPLDSMSSSTGWKWIIIVSILAAISALAAYLPNNTSYTLYKTRMGSYTNYKISHRAQFSGFDSLSSYYFLNLIPYTSNTFLGKNTITIQGSITFLDEALLPITTEYINESVRINCASVQCDDVILSKKNFVDFYSMAVVVDVESTLPILSGLAFSSSHQHSAISVSGFISISLVTLLNALLIYHLQARRQKVSREDHKAALFLGLLLLSVDGPWLMIKYYWTGNMTWAFDLSPEIFHIVFIIFSMIFMSVHSHGWARRVASSNFIRGAFALAFLSAAVMTFIAADGIPFAALRLTARNSMFWTPIIVVSSIFYVAVFCLMILGIMSLQIQEFSVFLLTAYMFTIFEAIHFVRFVLRFALSVPNIGFSFATDLLYILVANIVTFFFMWNCLPIEACEAEIKNTEKEVGCDNEAIDL